MFPGVSENTAHESFIKSLVSLILSFITVIVMRNFNLITITVGSFKSVQTIFRDLALFL